MQRARLIVADRQQLCADALRMMIAGPDYEIVACVSDGEGLLEAAGRLKPDLVLADASLPRVSGLEAVRVLRRTLPSVKAVILGAEDNRSFAADAFDAGAAGIVCKRNTASDLIRVIRLVLDGRARVTASPCVAEQANSGAPPAETKELGISPRQKEILQLVAQGLSRKEIAGRLNISVKTVEFHKAALARHLNLRKGIDYIRFALAHKLLSLTGENQEPAASDTARRTAGRLRSDI